MSTLFSFFLVIIYLFFIYRLKKYEFYYIIVMYLLIWNIMGFKRKLLYPYTS